MTQQLPHVSQRVQEPNGYVSTPWFAWFGRIDSALSAGVITADEATAAIRVICLALGSPDGTPENIPQNVWLPRTTYVRAGDGLDDSGALATGGVELSLETLADDGTGTFKLLTRDAYGRLEGTQDGSASDVPYDNATSGLSATDVQAAIDEVSASSGGGGILPMVNGEVPPVLMYFDDGSLLYAQVE